MVTVSWSTSPRVRQNTIAAVGDSTSRMRPRAAGLVGALHHVGALANERLARLGVALADLDAHGIALVALGDRVDARWQRGREQHGLALVGRGVEDRLEIVGETHVEHLVGFVEHHDAHVVEGKRSAPDVVDGAAGRGDDDVDAAVELLQLAVDRLAAVDRHDLDAEMPAVLEDRLADLHRQLAGGDQHERAGRGAATGMGVEVLQQWQREGCGLAGARGRLAEQIVTGDHRRDRLALDRRGLLVAEVVERGQQLGTEVERSETRSDWVGRVGIGGVCGAHLALDLLSPLESGTLHPTAGHNEGDEVVSPDPLARPWWGRAVSLIGCPRSNGSTSTRSAT